MTGDSLQLGESEASVSHSTCNTGTGDLQGQLAEQIMVPEAVCAWTLGKCYFTWQRRLGRCDQTKDPEMGRLSGMIQVG